MVLAETAYPWTTGNGDAVANGFNPTSVLPDGDLYPATPDGQRAYYEALRTTCLKIPNALGFVTWEPDWIPAVGAGLTGSNHDNLTQFDFTGRALPSIQAYRRP